MSYANLKDFMSFFFVAKYINGNGLSSRNIAPDINSKADIYTKTAKLVNQVSKHVFSKFNTLILENTDDAFVNPLNLHVSFNNSSRIKNRNQMSSLPAYSQFNSNFVTRVNFLQPKAEYIHDFNERYIKSFYLSLIFGANITSTQLFRSVYQNNYAAVGFINRFNDNPDSVSVAYFDSEAEIERYLAKYFITLSDISNASTCLRIAGNPADNFVIRSSGNQYVFNNVDYYVDNASGLFNNNINNNNNAVIGSSVAFNIDGTQTPLTPLSDDNSVVELSYQYLDIADFYNNEMSANITEAHRSFINNENIPTKLDNISYKNNAHANTRVMLSLNSRLGNIRRYQDAHNYGYSPFIRIVKIKFDNNKIGYILFTNIDDYKRVNLYLKGEFNFVFKQIAYLSSDNFNTAVDSLNTRLLQLFSKKEIQNV